MKSIKSRLIVALGVVECLTLAMALILYFGASQLETGSHRARRANDDLRELLDFALLAHRYMNAFGQSLGQRTLIANNERRTVATAFEERIANMGSGRDNALDIQDLDWKELREASTALNVELRAADALRAKGEFQDAERIFSRARKSLFDERMLPWFSQAIEMQRAQANAEQARAIANAASLRSAGAAVGVVSAALALAAVLSISRAIMGPVRSLMTGAEAIGRGDLKHRVEPLSSDEFSLLAERFNQMAETIAAAQADLLERKAKIELAYRLQGEFVSMVSHELRSPLHSIIGYIEFIEEDERGLGEQTKKNLSSMSSGARRLLSLINDILDFSKLEAQQMEAEITTFELSPLLSAVVEDARAAAHGKAVELVLDAPASPVLLKSDETRLRQILTNLLSNAVKFTHDGRVTLAANVGAEAVELRVADTGIGIPDEQLADIFQPFRQAKGGRAAGGTGLGLAIVSRLAQLIGAKVSVQSEPGKGTEFSVVLPTTS
jgi:signal transduction histidine kinase